MDQDEIARPFGGRQTDRALSKKWTSASFKQFGSLYFAHDLGKQNSQDPLYFDEHGTAMNNQRFAVGPSTGREYYDAGRASVLYDRGPCT